MRCCEITRPAGAKLLMSMPNVSHGSASVSPANQMLMWTRLSGGTTSDGQVDCAVKLPPPAVKIVWVATSLRSSGKPGLKCVPGFVRWRRPLPS